MTHNFQLKVLCPSRVIGTEVDGLLGWDFTLICILHRLCVMLATGFRFLPVVPLFFSLVLGFPEVLSGWIGANRCH